MTSWQPIETAPKDGTEVLLFVKEYVTGDSQQQVVGWWRTHGWVESYADEYGVCEVTHWMPLPEPPND